MSIKKRLEDLMRIGGVHACGVFVHGLPVDAITSTAVDKEKLFAYAQDLINYSEKVAEGIGSNSEFIMLEMNNEKLLVLPVDAGGVAVLTDRDANIGMVRVAMKVAIPEFKSYLVGG